MMSLSPLCLFALILGLLASTSSAQWLEVSHPVPKIAILGSASLKWDNGILWVGSGGVVARSTDTGRTWQDRTPPHMAAAGNQGSYDIFVRGTNMIIASSLGSAVSTDSGVTWKSIRGGSAGYIDSTGQTIITGFDALYISHDGGSNWRREPIITDLLQLVEDKGRVWAKGGKGLPMRNALAYSDDGCSTWNVMGSFPEADSYSFTIDSCDKSIFYAVVEDFYMRSIKETLIKRSMDSGRTWTTVATKPQDFFSGDLTNNRTTLFAATLTEGIQASTDQGFNWISIGGPSIGRADSRTLCLIDDSIMLALDSNGYLWRSNQAPYVQPLSVRLTVKDTIRLTQCDSIPLSVLAIANGCNAGERVILSAEKIDLVTVTTDVTIAETTLAKAVINDLTPGTHRYLILATSKNGNRVDSLPIVVIVDSIPYQKLDITPRTLELGAFAMCDTNTKRRFIDLSSLGCASIKNVSAKLEIVSGEGFVLGNVPTKITDKGSIVLDFRALSPGDHSVLLIIETDLGFDTVRVHASVEDAPRPGLTLQAETMAIPECDSLRNHITIENRGCQELVIDSVTLMTGEMLVKDQTILAGASLQVDCNLDESASGTITLRIRGKQLALGEWIELDTVIAFTVNRTLVPDRLAIDIAAVDLESAPCKEITFSIEAGNLLCREIKAVTSSLARGMEFTLGKQFELPLLSGDSTALSIGFTTTEAGTYFDTLLIGAGDTVYRIPLRITVLSTGPSIELSATSLDLGSVLEYCEDASGSFSIKNLGCEEMTIDSVSVFPLHFGASSAGDRVLPGENASVLVNMPPGTVGTRSSIVKIYYRSNGKRDSVTIPVTSKVEPRPRIELSLSPSTLSGVVNAELHLTIQGRRSGSAVSAQSDQMAIKLRLNTDLLGIESVAAVAPLQLVNTASGNGEIEITLDGWSQLGAGAALSDLLTINFKTFLSKDVSTDISVSLLHADTCMNADGSQAAASLLLLCGDSILVNALNDRPLLGFVSIIPNPARNYVQVRTSYTGPLDYQLITIDGKQAMHGMIDLQNDRIDTDRLARGSYQLILRTANQTRSIPIILE